MHEDGLEEGKDKEQDDELGDNSGCVGRAPERAAERAIQLLKTAQHTITRRRNGRWTAGCICTRRSRDPRNGGHEA